MRFENYLPEILLIGLLGPIFIACIVALLNLDAINNGILNFHQWVVKQHGNAKSGFTRFLWSIFKYPGEAPHQIGHLGWRSGLTLSANIFSTIVLGGVLAAIALIVYYVVMIAIVVIIVIVVIAVFLAIIGGGS
jgi:hypothetical protein